MSIPSISLSLTSPSSILSTLETPLIVFLVAPFLVSSSSRSNSSSYIPSIRRSSSCRRQCFPLCVARLAHLHHPATTAVGATQSYLFYLFLHLSVSEFRIPCRLPGKKTSYDLEVSRGDITKITSTIWLRTMPNLDTSGFSKYSFIQGIS
ncbi:hypothetical protein DER46DRAFT_47898 [Fusarium sp. MPI-SDFR-AT-0072]|nr:hypothetical protein DER46DRAFT_47898 [Fusarium sp. MPI-SDFR-AT-0072]